MSIEAFGLQTDRKKIMSTQLKTKNSNFMTFREFLNFILPQNKVLCQQIRQNKSQPKSQILESKINFKMALLLDQTIKMHNEINSHISSI